MQVQQTPIFANLPSPSPSSATIINAGPDTAYYAATFAAAAALVTANSGSGADGSIVAGASASLTTSKFFVCLRGKSASLDVRPLFIKPVASATVAYVVTVTQAEYDALTPDTATLYVVVG